MRGVGNRSCSGGLVRRFTQGFSGRARGEGRAGEGGRGLHSGSPGGAGGGRGGGEGRGGVEVHFARSGALVFKRNRYAMNGIPSLPP